MFVRAMLRDLTDTVVCWIRPLPVFERAMAEYPLWRRLISVIVASVLTFVVLWRWVLYRATGENFSWALDGITGLCIASGTVCVSGMVSLFWYMVLRKQVRRGFPLEPDFFRLLHAHLFYYPLLLTVGLLAAVTHAKAVLILTAAALMRWPQLEARTLRLSSGIRLADAQLVFFITLVKYGIVFFALIGVLRYLRWIQ